MASTERGRGYKMSDADVLGSIQQLAHEEHELREREGDGSLSDDERERLRTVELALDQCWDLLRQRRARAAAGLDPEEAQVRDVDTVEDYLS
jgi:hypothetical protein